MLASLERKERLKKCEIEEPERSSYTPVPRKQVDSDCRLG